MDEFTAKFFSNANFAYWLILAVVIGVEQLTFGRWWKRRESHRWTMGYATVFGLGLPLAIWGYWDFTTFASLFMAVGISGMLKVGLEALQASWKAQALREKEVSINGPDSGK